MLRFSLLTLLLVVLFVAVACAALVNASPLWAQLITSATVLALLVATVAAFYLPGNARAFAGGFAIFGWAYLLLIQGPWFEGMKTNLLTTAAVDGLESLMKKEETGAVVTFDAAGAVVTLEISPPSVIQQGSTIYTDSGSGTYVARPLLGQVTSTNQSPLPRFHQIGHSLWTILLACLGGVLARVFQARKKATAT